MLSSRPSAPRASTASSCAGFKSLEDNETYLHNRALDDARAHARTRSIVPARAKIATRRARHRIDRAIATAMFAARASAGCLKRAQPRVRTIRAADARARVRPCGPRVVGVRAASADGGDAPAGGASGASAAPGASGRGRVSWDARLAELSTFKAMYGTVELPRELNALRRWLSRQRSERRAGRLSDARAEKLEALGVTWDLRKTVTRRPKVVVTFDERVRELAKYYAAHGNGNVKASENDALAKWVSHQIASYRDGGLSEDKYDALISLGVNFDNHDERAVHSWDDRLAELKSFAQANGGSTRVPEDEEHAGLYFWLLEQRRSKRDGKLNVEKTHKLESVGVEWEIKPHNEVPWGTRFTELAQFVRAHGDLPSNKDDPTLFQWVRAQRKRYAKGMMEDDRAALLDGLPLDRDWKVTPMSAFEKNLARLKTFVKANGHAIVSSHDDKKLATWLRKQRIKKQSGELNKSKINALEALGVQWTAAPVMLDEANDTSAKLFGTAFQNIESQEKKSKKK